MSNIKEIIQSVLEQEFKDVRIESVDVREAVDYEDDAVLYVTVVFQSLGRLDSKASAGFVRHVRSRLHEIQEERFPVMSFISSDDYEERLAETA